MELTTEQHDALRTEIDAIVRGEHSDPFRILGPHREQNNQTSAVIVRAFLPQAQAVEVLPVKPSAPNHPTQWRMQKIHPDGFFEARIEAAAEPFVYSLRVTGHDGRTAVIDDPYRFLPLV